MEPCLDVADLVLVMSVEAGFGGQKFNDTSLTKLRELRPKIRPEVLLEIDGGINAETIRHARAAGVDWFVVASAIYDKPDRAAAIAELREKLR